MTTRLVATSEPVHQVIRSVTGHVDLANCTPGCTPLLNHSSVVVAQYADSRIFCECAGGRNKERHTEGAARCGRSAVQALGSFLR